MDTLSEFRSLASLLLERGESGELPPAEPIAVPPEFAESEEVRDAWKALARETRLFRARLEDELAIALDALLSDVAAEVLGRELRLGAVDLQRIVSAAIARYAHEEPLRVRVHPDDAEPLAELALGIVCDENLRRGDAVLELRSGTIDATLGTRLETLLHKAAER